MLRIVAQRAWRRWVVAVVFAGCIAWLAFQGWQAILGAVGVAIGLLAAQALVRWEQRGKG